MMSLPGRRQCFTPWSASHPRGHGLHSLLRRHRRECRRVLAECEEAIIAAEAARGVSESRPSFVFGDGRSTSET